MVVDDVLGEICPGTQFERHLLSAVDLQHHAPRPARYPARLIMRAMLTDGGGLAAKVPHPQTGLPESVCDLLCCRDLVAGCASLVCGPDTHASQLSLLTRQRLGAALDPPEKLGRDWCLLAVQLGMTDRLPELDPDSKESGGLLGGKSPIARVLGEWTLVMDSTIGHLARALDELGRGDAADIVLGTSPLVKVAVAPASAPGKHDDAGISSAAANAAAVSAASSSNISR